MSNPKKNKNISDSNSKLNCKFIIFLILFVLCILIVVTFLRESDIISYNIFYRPMYYIVGQSFYSSFYVLLIKRFLMFILFLLLIRFVLFREFFKSENKFFSKLRYFVFFIAIVCVGYFTGKDTVKDIQVLTDGGYETDQSNLSSIYHSIAKRRKYDYYIVARENLEINVYQYKELEYIKEQFAKKMITPKKVAITVNYLPNTKCVLNYEIIEK